MSKTIEELREAGAVAIIDGNSLMHRAFHAVPLNMSAPDGRCTNACFGFISMLIKMLDEFNPSAVICAFDAGRPKFRMEALSQYKAQRPPMDPMLKEQFPIIEGLLDSMSIPVVKIPGWEGDDILGTLGLQAEQAGKIALLVTGDKDAYQLASEHVFIVTTRKGLSDVVIYDPDAVYERYGVTPSQVPDFLGLKGDPSDNIPGVQGIGEKTASKLLQEYGDLEGVFDHADSIKGKMGENLRGGRKDAETSRLVATIRRDVPIELDLEGARFPSFKASEVARAFDEVRFSTHLKKILDYANDGSIALEETGSKFFGSKDSKALIVSEPVLEGEEAYAALDAYLEDRGDGEERCVGAMAQEKDEPSLFDTGFRLFVALPDCVAVIDDAASAETLARLAKQTRIICAGAKDLLHRIYPPDSSVEAMISTDELYRADIFDVSIAAYLLESERRDYSIPAIAPMCLGTSLPPAEDKTVRDAQACACLLPLAKELKRRLEECGSLKCFHELEMPLVPVLSEMERTGVNIDTGVLSKIDKGATEQIETLKKDIYREAGEQFNVDSPKQLGSILFDKLGLPPTKKTKSGYSTDAKVLEKLRGLHPLPSLVEKYRELAKIKSTYLDVLPALIAGDGRVHTHFNQTATATGRLSSSDPNLQNIPVRTDFGRHIRSAFVPRQDDWEYLCADYSQIELRLLAHLSGDEHMISAFKSGADFHAATASRVFGVRIEDVDPHMRSRAKAVNFGIVYGQQAFGLGQTLHIPMREAQGMIDRYFDAYPTVREYLDGLVEYAREHAFVQTMFGRRRQIPGIASGNAQHRALSERTAMNHPMQGSAADIIKKAMAEVMSVLHESDIAARLCIQVHDELDFEVASSDVERLGDIVRSIMENTVKLDVPLKVDVQHARAWSQAH